MKKAESHFAHRNQIIWKAGNEWERSSEQQAME